MHDAKWPWYDIVSGPEIDQGDIIPDFPVLKLISEANAELMVLRTAVVVMTQTCDLANRMLSDVVLCPVASIAKFVVTDAQFRKQALDSATRLKIGGLPDSERPEFEATIWKIIDGSKEIRKQLDAIAKGQRPAYVTLAKHEIAPNFPMSLVSFHHVFVQPRGSVERCAATRGNRLRLRPPYRDYLSQAFGRVFMRVGLYNDIPRLAP